MFIDSIAKVILDGGDLIAHLREIRENNEVMMQRDPEIMKQKRIGSRPSPSASVVNDEDDLNMMRKR